MRFAVAKQQGLTEDTVAEITDGFSSSALLSPAQQAALAFTDAFLSNEPGSQHLLADHFEPAEAMELATGLGLFHGFGKVLIGLGQEPEEGTMPTTELPTPDTPNPYADLQQGLHDVAAAVAGVADEAGRLALMGDLRVRVRQMLGVESGDRPTAATPADACWLDMAELFVVDIHAIDDALFTSATVGMDAATARALFVGLAMVDAQARLERSVASC